MGTITFLSFIPVAVLPPLGGVLADRFAHRRVLLVTMWLQLLLAAALWWVADDDSLPLVTVGIIVLLSGIVLACTGPAWQALCVELVPRRDLPSTISLNSAQFNIARAVGPLIAGVLLGSDTGRLVFGINALSYLAVIGALLVMRAPDGRVSATRFTPILDIRQGVHYVRSHSALIVAIFTVGALSALAGPFSSFIAVYTGAVYDVGPGMYGALLSAYGAGAVVGPIVVAAIPLSVARSRVIVICLLVIGVANLLFAVLPHLVVGFVLAFVIGGSFVAGAATLNTVVHLHVSDAMRGRVLALYFVAGGGSYPIGSVLQGAFAEVIGIRAVTALAGALLLAIAFRLTRDHAADVLDAHGHRTSYRLERTRRRLGQRTGVRPGNGEEAQRSDAVPDVESQSGLSQGAMGAPPGR